MVYASAVLDCADSIVRRECILARQVGYGGVFRVDNNTAAQLEDDEHGVFVGYDYIRFDGVRSSERNRRERYARAHDREPQSRAQV